jgi:hypothetical protein
MLAGPPGLRRVEPGAMLDQTVMPEIARQLHAEALRTRGMAMTLIQDNEQARACVRTIAGWKPLPPKPPRARRPRRDD